MTDHAGGYLFLGPGAAEMAEEIQRVAALPLRRWALDVAWPDGRRVQLEVSAATQEYAESHALDTFGASVTVTATPAEPSAP